ncbi:MAG: lysine transporter LysE [Actinobacteria bacterium]|nr:lysine transporter LysE [Actinomycetota bacterium]
MTLSVWLSLLPASVLISFTPGAGAINTMTNSLNEGFRRSIWGIIGQQVALVVHIVIVAAGVGLLVAGSPVLFDSIRYAGAAYLVYLGIRMFTAAPEPAAEGALPAEVVVGEPAWSMVRRGIWVNLLNPKAVVFFLAFTPQFIRPGMPLLPQYVAFTATIVVVDILVMWFFFAAAAKGFRRWTRSPRGARALNRVFGALFVLVALTLVFLE